MSTPPTSPAPKSPPPHIARIRMKRLRATHPNLLHVIDMRKSFDVGTLDYKNATEIIADMIAVLRDEDIICDCWLECTDIKTFEDKKDEEETPISNSPHIDVPIVPRVLFNQTV